MIDLRKMHDALQYDNYSSFWVFMKVNFVSLRLCHAFAENMETWLCTIVLHLKPPMYDCGTICSLWVYSHTFSKCKTSFVQNRTKNIPQYTLLTILILKEKNLYLLLSCSFLHNTHIAPHINNPLLLNHYPLRGLGCAWRLLWKGHGNPHQDSS